MFRSICKIVVVAARPLNGGLDQNPPLVDLFWGDDNDAEIDPDECKLPPTKEMYSISNFEASLYDGREQIGLFRSVSAHVGCSPKAYD